MVGPALSLPQSWSATAVDKGFIADLAFLIILWCLASLIANPVGNFPLIDDWSFGRTATHLANTGEFRPLGWALMTLVANVYWGALFCLPEGCSFTALRVSTLVAALIGVFGVYILVRDVRQPRWLALLVALAVGFNPIYYALSNSFMTDVPFTVLAIWAAVFLTRYLHSGLDTHLFLGTILAAAATLSRQLALFVPLGFAMTVLLRPALTPRSVIRAGVPLAFCVAALIGLHYWLQVSGRVPALYGSLAETVIAEVVQPTVLLSLLFNSYYVVACFGLFLLPMLILALGKLWRAVGKRTFAFTALGILAVAVAAVFAGKRLFGLSSIDLLMPIFDRGNVIGKPGLGPLSLRDTQLLHLDDHMPALPLGFWILVTAFSLFGAVLLVGRLCGHFRHLLPQLLQRRPKIGDMDAAGVFLILSGAIYVGFFILIGFFDRYLIPALPFLAVGLIALAGQHTDMDLTCAKPTRTIAFTLLASVAVFSVVSTRDWLGWNRLRWEALADLTQEDGIGPKYIDGGFEFNGLHFYDPNYKPQPGKSGWWVQDDTYLIGFGPVPGYTVMKEYSYRHWLPPRVQKVVVMRKN